MKNQLIKRLAQLEKEYEKGQEQLQQLEAETTKVQTAMLRISGAVQVLKEELELSEQEDNSSPPNGIAENVEEVSEDVK